MDQPSTIPQIDFQNRQTKAFEFEINTAKELLSERRTHDHNPFRPHRIAFYAIIFVIEGEGFHFIDFKKYSYQKGTILFISKEQVHAFQKNEHLNAYFLLFTEKFLERSSLGSNLMQQLTVYNYHLYSPVLQLDEERFQVFYDMVIRIKREFDAPDDFATEEIIQSALKIFLFLAERIRKTRLKTLPQAFYQEEFNRFQKLLRQYVFTNRQVKFYADRMAISTKKLNRITYEITQMPAKTYIIDTLILEIKRFLMNTALSIKEIAYQTGFEAPTNFVKFFKQHAQITPAEFRRQYQGKV